MASFKPAQQPQILRAFRKDEQHISALQREVSDVSRMLFGIPWWIRWKSDLEALSTFVYYFATTLSGLQTLGEEYVHIVQVKRSLKEMPSFAQRLADTSLHTFGGKLISAVINYSSAKNNGSYSTSVRIIFDKLYRAHLTLFYLFGTYYTPAKRLTGVQYVLIRKWLSSDNGARYYRILGWLSLAELLVSTVREICAARQHCSSSIATKLSTKYSCSMCMEPARDATVIPCGHVYCWRCIAGWLSTKPGCPLCRSDCEPQQMSLLHNVK